MFPGMNTVQIQRYFLKGKRISYQKMPLFLSGDPYRKIQKLPNSDMTDFDKILEIRPISGQANSNFMYFHAKYVCQKSRNVLNMSLKNIESCLKSLQVSWRLFRKNMNIFKIILYINSNI